VNLIAQKPSKVRATVDPDRDGKQVGRLVVPHSRNDSAWGSIRVPIAVIKNGTGPTVLFAGGNHGDEYEGPIALVKLLRELQPEAVQGRVIIIPMLNLPAVEAGTRLSPIDGLNMNRIFPGDRDGTVSLMVADYVSRYILPDCDAVVDIHAGGKTLYFSPFAAIHNLPDPDLMTRAQAALDAFAAPISLVLEELDAEGMLDTEVERMGKVFISTELGGGGTASPATVGIAERGVRNVLRHFNVIEGEIERPEDFGLAPSRRMVTPDAGYVLSDDSGMLEMLVELDAEVRAGDPVAAVHRIDRPDLPPAVYEADCDGLLIGRAHPGLVKPGDFIGLVGQDA